MFRIQKTMEIAGAHRLNLPYDSKCSNHHGHNWLVTVYCKSEGLNENGMVVDFVEIKREVHDKLDHQCLNDIKELGWIEIGSSGCIDVNPTAERLAEWICYAIPTCYRVDVQESIGNIATFEYPG